jgi:hypothetical protein
MLGQVSPTYLLTDFVFPLTLGIVANRLLQHVCRAFSIIVVVVVVAVVGIVRDQGIFEYQSREVDLLEEAVVVSGDPYNFGDKIPEADCHVFEVSGSGRSLLYILEGCLLNGSYLFISLQFSMGRVRPGLSYL